VAGRISPEIQRLLVDRKLIRATASRAMILRELDAAKNDLADARDSLGRQKYKWATIQGYYSMVHSAFLSPPNLTTETSNEQLIFLRP
jgi:hypothetical protein